MVPSKQDLIRLDKYIAVCCEMSRNDARTAIKRGLVCVQGLVCCKADKLVSVYEAITFKGKALTYEPFIYIMLHKPKGVVSATQDKNDQTVVDCVKNQYPKRKLFPVGRLDKDSTGFILLTDDGVFAHEIANAKSHITKTYEVILDAPVCENVIKGFQDGVVLADHSKMRPAKLQVDQENPKQARVILTQGVYHQIKRMFGVYQIGVCELKRIAIGDVLLDPTLKEGQFRHLSLQERECLLKKNFSQNNGKIV